MQAQTRSHLEEEAVGPPSRALHHTAHDLASTISPNTPHNGPASALHCMHHCSVGVGRTVFIVVLVPHPYLVGYSISFVSPWRAAPHLRACGYQPEQQLIIFTNDAVGMANAARLAGGAAPTGERSKAACMRHSARARVTATAFTLTQARRRLVCVDIDWAVDGEQCLLTLL